MASPSVTKTDTGWDVEYGDKYGIVGVSSEQAKSEKAAIKVANKVHDELVAMDESKED